METFRVYVFLYLMCVSRGLAVHLHCFGHSCHDPHKSVCLVNFEHEEFNGKCENSEHCHADTYCTTDLVNGHAHGHMHGPGHGHAHDCCCMNQQCIDDLSGGIAVHGTSVTCLDHTCDHHHPFCQMKIDKGHLTGHCVDEKHCVDHHNRVCTATADLYEHEGCCCQHQTCVSTLTGTGHNTTSGTTAIIYNNLNCSDCDNLLDNTCKHDHVTCGPNEVCKIKLHHDGKVSTSCQTIVGCAHEKVDDAKHHDDRQTICCGSDSCSLNAVQDLLIGHLTCPECKNQFIGDCHGDHLCGGGQTCMFEVKHGVLSSKCTADCQKHLSSHSDTVCCSDNDCVTTTMKNSHQLAFECPICTAQSGEECRTRTITCSQFSEGCSIVQSAQGYTAGCSHSIATCLSTSNNNSVLCNITPRPPFSVVPQLQCQTCCNKGDTHCINDALGLSNVSSTNPTTAAPVTVHTTYVSPTTAAYECPTCTEQSGQECQSQTQACSQLSQGCSIVQTARGFTAGCSNSITTCTSTANNNSVLCEITPHPPFLFDPHLHCQTCCSQGDTDCLTDTLGLSNVTNSTIGPTTVTSTPSPTLTIQNTTEAINTTNTGCPPFDLSCPPGCGAYDANFCPICDTRTCNVSGGSDNQSSTVPVVMATTTTPVVTQRTTSVDPSCYDVQDEYFNCTEYDYMYGLCHHTTGHSGQIAYVRCMKTCGHCNDVNPYATTTAAPKVCQDTSPSCQTVQASVCSSHDPTIRNFAVANCANTCGVCDEFLHLASIAPTTASVASPSTPVGVTRMCNQCGHKDLGIPCHVRDVSTDVSTLCPPDRSFCQTDVIHDGNGNVEIYKRCVDELTCNHEWLDQTSDLDYCTNYGDTPIPGRYSCHFCCIQDGCNTGVMPNKTTLYSQLH